MFQFSVVEFPQEKSFLDDLYGLEGDEVDALFNGISVNGISDYPGFNPEPERYKGTCIMTIFSLFIFFVSVLKTSFFVSKAP